MRSLSGAWLAIFAASVAGAAARGPIGAEQGAAPAAGFSIRFTDVTAAAGIRFRHHSGAFGKKYLPETMGSGCAFVDVDGDGWQDVVFVQSMDWPGRAGTKVVSRALPEQSQRHLHRHHARGGAGGRDVRPRRRGGGLRQRRRRRHLHHGARPEPPVPERRARPLRRRHRAGRRRRPRVLDERPLVRLRPRRPAGPVRRPLRASGRSRRTGSARSNGRTKSYCTPESYKGQSPVLYRNKRRRHVRERHEEGRAATIRRTRCSASR